MEFQGSTAPAAESDEGKVTAEEDTVANTEAAAEVENDKPAEGEEDSADDDEESEDEDDVVNDTEEPSENEGKKSAQSQTDLCHQLFQGNYFTKGNCM